MKLELPQKINFPKDWILKRLKFVGKFDSSGIDKKDREDEVKVYMINYTDVYNNPKRILDSSKSYMVTTCSEEKLEKYNLLKGDLLFTPSSETTEEIGYSALVVENMPNTVFSYHLIRFRFNDYVDLNYRKYLCQNSMVLAQFAKESKGSTRKILGRDEFNNTIVAIPPLKLQKKIANFLDKETARIDALIEEKQQMLDLLEEKRTALISRVVTRGVDPSVEMKPSGVEWIGEIPKHWQKSKFNREVFIVEGQVDPEVEPYRDYVLIAPNHIEQRTGHILKLETAQEQGAISGKYLCKKGDVIYSKIRPALRKACLATFDCLCSADMYPLRPREKLNSEYLLFFILSEQFSTWAILESQRVAMPKINRESLSSLTIFIPPIEEQELIVKYLKDRIRLIDKQLKYIAKSIKLLQERRTALITAAVTGQLDIA